MNPWSRIWCASAGLRHRISGELTPAWRLAAGAVFTLALTWVPSAQPDEYTRLIREDIELDITLPDALFSLERLNAGRS